MTSLTLNYLQGKGHIMHQIYIRVSKKSCDCRIIHLFLINVCVCVNDQFLFFAPAVKSLSWWSISTWQLLTTKSHPSSTCMGLLTSYHYPTSMPVGCYFIPISLKNGGNILFASLCRRELLTVSCRVPKSVATGWFFKKCCWIEKKFKQFSIVIFKELHSVNFCCSLEDICFELECKKT